MAIQIKLGDLTFKTKKAARKYIQDVLQNSDVGEPIVSPVLDDLIARHPESSEKIGAGICHFYVGINEYGSRGFYIRRIDGTDTDFSYRVCLDARKPKQRSNVLKALRYEVSPQVLRFRDAKFNGRCELSGQSLRVDEVHVDHSGPTFSELVDGWVRALELDIDQIRTRNAAGSGERIQLCDRELARSWRRYHEWNANLRCISRELNMKMGDRGEESVKEGAGRIWEG